MIESIDPERRRLLGGVASSFALLPAGRVVAQQPWPTKPVRILVGFTPGGVPDIAARLLSQRLTETWRQPIVVENRLGAGSNVAAQAAAMAAPDGHTLLSVSSAHAVAPAIQSKLSFDPINDFAPITLTATGPALVIVAPDLPVKTIDDLIRLARARPGDFNFASAGVGSGAHFAVELLRSQTGINLVHVPFKGIPEALNETIAGRTHLFVSPYASAINLVRQGKARAIAVTSTSRMADMPDLPTVSESGAPGYRWIFWYGLLAPARTPAAIIDRIQADVAGVLSQPDVRERFRSLGTEAVTNTPAEFSRLIADEVASFTQLARQGNIKAD